MWIIAAAAAGLVGTVLALILGQYRPEFRMLVTAAVTLLLMAMVLEQLDALLARMREITAAHQQRIDSSLRLWHSLSIFGALFVFIFLS